MNNYIIFEAGSRCGLSAYFFLKDYMNKTGEEIKILMVDRDNIVVASFDSLKDRKVESIKEDIFYSQLINELDSNIWKVFPADEMNRQLNFHELNRRNLLDEYSSVNPIFYDKCIVNQILSSLELKTVKIPKTYYLPQAFIKPNSQSAGSRGTQSLTEVCVSEKNKYCKGIRHRRCYSK